MYFSRLKYNTLNGYCIICLRGTAKEFDMIITVFILKTLQSRRLLQGLIKEREIELSCDISTGQYQSSSGLLRYHEFTEIYMK